MAEFYDALETRDPNQRERDLLGRLPAFIAAVMERAPGWKTHLAGIEPRTITSRAALSQLPLLRKSDLKSLQGANPPFAGLATTGGTPPVRIFASPGPIFEPQKEGDDPWRAARGLFAAGFRKGDLVLNCFAYHLTPGGFIMDTAARALGCTVIPGGPGNVDLQVEAIGHLRPNAYTGTPDFLKILLDRCEATGTPGSIAKAQVSGAALPPSLREELASRGVDVRQCYALAEVGMVAYETEALEGMVISEDVIVEIVRPGTGDPVPEGEIGEVVVTTFSDLYPMIRLATGDLSALLPGASACGRTNARIKGWLGRADQTAKVKGMFVQPGQIAEIGKRHPELGRLRLVVTRANEQDAMLLRAESTIRDEALKDAVAASLRAVTKLRGDVELVATGSLPLDGKVIHDERRWD
ncbi:phenylacetate-CoA ligase [Rhodoligotrophos appendicifer]|uniref:phenylacetate--CoA ligase family protein n=1 Tax=Rhodoligotrophos appendicifer TaxID=987056 RepID=UPI00117BE17C|nr:AMP-binding protein [Rhodoligotrophos appendicifer]